jgi:hypothetical protein
LAKGQINGRLICRHHWFVNTLWLSTLATSKAIEYLQTNGDGKSGVHLSALLPI